MDCSLKSVSRLRSMLGYNFSQFNAITSALLLKCTLPVGHMSCLFPKNDEKNVKKTERNEERNHIDFGRSFLKDFGANLLPFPLPKSTKDPPKIDF